MAAVAFDTLQLAERLEAAGMPPQQARGAAAALAEALSTTVATAADVRESELRLRSEVHEGAARLHSEIAALRGEVHDIEADLRSEITALRGEVREGAARLGGEIAAVESRLRTEIATVRTEIATVRTEIATVRTEITGLRAELIRWAVGVGIAAVLAIGGMILTATLALLRLH